jgi:hypothetical protein
LLLMPRKRIRRALEAKAWVVELASKPPSAVGVTVGSKRRQGDELWTLMALRRYAREHGPKELANLEARTLRRWFADPELKAKVKLYDATPKPSPPRKLPPIAKGQLVATKSVNGFQHRGLDEPAPKVSLPTVFFATRPEIPLSDRERLGADFKVPPPVTERASRLKDDDIIMEGEAALRRIRGSAPMADHMGSATTGPARSANCIANHMCEQFDANA